MDAISCLTQAVWTRNRSTVLNIERPAGLTDCTMYTGNTINKANKQTQHIGVYVNV